MQNLPPTPAIQFPDPKTVTYYQLFASIPEIIYAYINKHLFPLLLKG